MPPYDAPRAILAAAAAARAAFCPVLDWLSNIRPSFPPSVGLFLPGAACHLRLSCFLRDPLGPAVFLCIRRRCSCREHIQQGICDILDDFQPEAIKPLGKSLKNTFKNRCHLLCRFLMLYRNRITDAARISTTPSPCSVPAAPNDFPAASYYPPQNTLVCHAAIIEWC